MSVGCYRSFTSHAEWSFSTTRLSDSWNTPRACLLCLSRLKWRSVGWRWKVWGFVNDVSCSVFFFLQITFESHTQKLCWTLWVLSFPLANGGELLLLFSAQDGVVFFCEQLENWNGSLEGKLLLWNCYSNVRWLTLTNPKRAFCTRGHQWLQIFVNRNFCVVAIHIPTAWFCLRSQDVLLDYFFFLAVRLFPWCHCAIVALHLRVFVLMFFANWLKMTWLSRKQKKKKNRYQTASQNCCKAECCSPPSHFNQSSNKKVKVRVTFGEGMLWPECQTTGRPFDPRKRFGVLTQDRCVSDPDIEGFFFGYIFGSQSFWGVFPRNMLFPLFFSDWTFSVHRTWEGNEQFESLLQPMSHEIIAFLGKGKSGSGYKKAWEETFGNATLINPTRSCWFLEFCSWLVTKYPRSSHETAQHLCFLL